ncbi:nuclear transport factor 2 family protein [Streptomyces sp. NPDC052042]|uniref:nuclear transport factor 2 family protein n=1 Tax=Streptomyces sp. NPDC052042 TaxID=3365683 RepID=UPI0037CEFFA3
MEHTTRLDELAQRLSTLEDQAAIRRLMSRNQWRSDGGDDSDDRVPSWRAAGAVRALGPPSVVGTDPAKGPGYWTAHGGTWRSTGLSERFDTARSARGEERAAFSAARRRWMPQAMHFLTNEDIEITSSGSARGRWYSWEAATVVLDGVPTAVWIAGRYVVAFTKESGSWRIADMHFQEIFSTPVDSAGWTVTPHVPYGPGQTALGSGPTPQGAPRAGNPQETE